MLCKASTVRSAAMNPDDVLYRFRVRTLALSRRTGQSARRLPRDGYPPLDLLSLAGPPRRFGLDMLRSRERH